ncbi:hypothetical protein QZH41_019552, partial [Actinostola sp. cb2023]
MASCMFRTLLAEKTSCATSAEYADNVECVSLKNCTRDVTGHLKLYKLSTDEHVDNEMKLLLARTAICATCKKNMKNQESVLPEPLTPPSVPPSMSEISVESHVEGVSESDEGKQSSSPEESEESKSNSLERMTDKLSLLHLDDPLFSPHDTASTTSTQSDDPAPSTSLRHEKLNNFLLSCGIAPVERHWLKWDESSERTQQRYTQRSAEIVSAVLKTISADNAGTLWQVLTTSLGMNKILGIDALSVCETNYLEALSESYNNATSWESRRQILSIMSGVTSYNNIAKFIPGLTRWRHSMANLHRLQFGPGTQVQHQPSTRIKVDLKQLDHFISFITSPHLVQDLPFGKRHLKMSSGQIIEVPNVIRMMIPQRIVRQYSQYCEETGFTPFSERTMLRVLSECSASVRKSLQGLDYFAAEGAQAFDNLIALVRQRSQLGSDKDWVTKTLDVLKTSKLYLKGDYKVHVTDYSHIAEHCLAFSLSDSNDVDYNQQCDHHHDAICERCQALAYTLMDIEKVVSESTLSENDRDEAIYLVQSAKLAIHSWQCHILRCVNQDKARFHVLELLDNDTVLIINDWAMKFLPQKYRESQADWFGKRGISWHISVVHRGASQWQAFVHLIQSCSQDSSSVVFIMQDVLSALKKEHPEIKTAYIRQDNAGCYHSSGTILACPEIAKSTGIKIARIDFSDPQGGKGAADRLAATCKCHIRTYINEGNDVSTAEQMKDALLSSGGIEGVRVVSLETIDNPNISEHTPKIPAISKLNNFEFSNSSIRVWRAYGIGAGKEITIEQPSN